MKEQLLYKKTFTYTTKISATDLDSSETKLG